MAKQDDNSQRVFISHTWEDTPFAKKLAQDIEKLGYTVWLDEAQLLVGDSVFEEVEKGIATSCCMIVVLSPESVASKWVQNEIRAGLTCEKPYRRAFVLPVMYRDVEVPLLLRDRLYADFRKSYEVGFRQIVKSLKERRRTSHAEFSPVEGAQLDKKLADYYGTRQIGDSIIFTTLYPKAQSVKVAGNFNNWQPEETPMKRVAESGAWQIKLKLPRGRYCYRFVVDGTWMQDSYNDKSEPNGFGDYNSILEVE